MDKYNRFDYSRLDVSEIFDRLASRPEGLSAAEANKRLRDNGSNLLHTAPRHLPLFGGTLSALIVLLLLLAAVIAFLSDVGGTTAVILLVAALINAAFSLVLQRGGEVNAKGSLELQAADAKVLRGGKEQSIPAHQLVLGDVVLLKQNDVVPADVRIFEENGFITDESSFTAQHGNVRKFTHAISGEVAPLQRHNLALLGTSVVSGTAKGVIIGTGNHSELARIAYLAAAPSATNIPKTAANTPYGAWLTSAVVLLAAVLVITAVTTTLSVQAILFYAICLLVALTPAALLPVKAANLAAAVSRLAKAGMSVKKVSATQALGRCQVLLYDTASESLPECTTFHEVRVGKSTYAVEPTGLTNKGKALSAAKTKDMSLLFTAAALGSGHRITASEKALASLADLAKLDAAKNQSSHKEFKLFPYDAGRRLHSIIREYNGQNFVFVQGAPDALLSRCAELWDNGHVRKLSKADKELFLAFQASHRKAGSDVIALAYRILPASSKPHEMTTESAEKNLTLLGVAAMATPLQSTLPQLLQAAAGTKLPVTFITNLNPEAVTEVTSPVLPHSLTVLSGDDLAKASDGQLSTLMSRGNTFFCQISYEDKLRLVEILQRSGLSVAVSGDGLYDAPALARADCGIAGGQSDPLGIAGLQLNNQGFAGLVTALDISRLTQKNFALMLRCILTTITGKLLLVLLSLLGTAFFHIPAIIGIVPLLAIDMIALAFPLAALSWHSSASNDPSATPDPATLFSHEALGNYIKFGLVAASLACLSFLAYFAYSEVSPAYIDSSNTLHAGAATLAFLVFALSEGSNVLFVAGSVTRHAGRRLAFGFICSLLLIVTMMYNPLVQPLAGTVNLRAVDWLIALLAVAVYVLIRLAQRHTVKHTRHEIIKLHKEIHGHNSPARI